MALLMQSAWLVGSIQGRSNVAVVLAAAMQGLARDTQGQSSYQESPGTEPALASTSQPAFELQHAHSRSIRSRHGAGAWQKLCQQHWGHQQGPSAFSNRARGMQTVILPKGGGSDSQEGEEMDADLISE